MANTITKAEYLARYPQIEGIFNSDSELGIAVHRQNLKEKIYLEDNYSYSDFKKDFFRKPKKYPLMTKGIGLSEEKLNEVKEGIKSAADFPFVADTVSTVGSIAEKLDRAKDTVVKTGSSIADFSLSGFRSEEENKERKIEREARQELQEINRLRKPKDDTISQVTRSALTDIAYLANKFVGDKVKPRGDLSKIREFHKIAVKEGRYEGTWEEFLNDPKGITTKYGLSKAVIAVDALPEQFKKDLINGILPENETELSNFRIEGTRPTSKTGKLASFAIGDIAPFIVGTTKLKAGADMFIRSPNWLKQADKFVETAKESGKLSKRFLGVTTKGVLNFVRYAPSAELTTQVLLNPYEDRLSKIVGEMMAQDDGFADDVITFLATDDSDSELKARLDMALEGAVTWAGLSTFIKGSLVTGFSVLQAVKASKEKAAMFIGKAVNPSFKGRAAQIRDSSGKLLPEKIEQFAILHNPSEGKTGNFLHSMMENVVLVAIKAGGPLSRQMTAAKQTSENKIASVNYEIENTVNNLGKEIDNLIVVSKGVKFKDKNLNTSEKIWDHIGRIITKDYPKVEVGKEASKVPVKKLNKKTGKFEDSGKSWDNQLLKSIDFEKDLKALPSEIAKSVRLIRLQVDTLSSNIMNSKSGFISPEVKAIIEANLGKYLKTQYEFFTSPYWKPTKTVIDTYVDYIANNRHFRQYVRENMKDYKRVAGENEVYRYSAIQYVNGIVNNKKVTQSLVNYGSIFDDSAQGAYRNIHKNLFSKKQKLSKEARAFYGEITDPPQRIVATIRALSRYVETDKMFKTFEELGKGVSLHKGAPKGRYTERLGIKTASSSVGTAEKLVLPKLGALDDYYTTPKIARIFNEIAGVEKRSIQRFFEDTDTGRMLGMPLVALKGFANINATVLSNTTQIRNFMAGPLFMLANGRVPSNYRELEKAYSTVALTIGNMSNVELQAFEKMLIKEGVINSSVVVSQLKQTMKSAGDGFYAGKVRNFFRADPDANIIKEGTKKGVRGIAGVLSTTVGKAQEIYVGSDNFWKILYFQDQRRVLKEAYKLHDKVTFKNKKEKIAFDKKLDRQAADIVKNTMPNYNMVAPIFRDAAYTPLGSFFAFRYEEIRTSFNALGLGIRQSQSSNSIIRKAGEKRVAGSLGSMLIGAGGIADLTTNSLNGITDAERWAMEKLRKDYEKYSRTATMVDSDTGKLSLVNMTYLDPYSDISRVVARLAIDAIDNKITIEEFNDSAVTVVKEMFLEVIEPFIMPGIAPQAITDSFIKGKTSSGKQIVQDINPDSPFALAFQGDNLLEIMEHITITSLTPKAVINMNNLIQAYKDQGSGKAYKRNFAHELIANLTGIKIQEFDLESNFRQATSKYIRAEKNLTSTFNNNLSREEYTEEELQEAFSKYNSIKYSLRSSIKETVTAAEILGMGINDIDRILKSLSISKIERDIFINSNVFRPSYLKERQADNLLKSNPNFGQQVGKTVEFNYKLRDKINGNLKKTYWGKKTLINFNMNKEDERKELEKIRPFEPVPDWIEYIRNNTDNTSFKKGMIKEKLSDREKLKEGGRVRLATGTDPLAPLEAFIDPEDRNNIYAGESFFETTRPSLRARMEKRKEVLDEQRKTDTGT